MPNPFPSLKAVAMLRLLQGALGYDVARQKGVASEAGRRGRPNLTFAFHDKDSLSPGMVRDILVKQVGLDPEVALKVVRDER